jgi:outer membrane protein OmpU
LEDTMKKQLMTTTALVAAGLVAMSGVALGASKPKLSVGGSFSVIGSAVSQEATGYLSPDIWGDGEVHFKGSVKLDSGITIKTQVELETNGNTYDSTVDTDGDGTGSSEKDLIDEAYMSISGSFGQIKLGSEDSAGNLLLNGSFGSNATNAGRHLGLHTGKSIASPSGHKAKISNVLALGDADSEKIIYFTPRMSGFMLGASYTPSFTEGKQSQGKEADGTHHGLSIGGHWKGNLGGAKVQAAAGYNEAQSKTSTAADLKGYGVAVKATIGAITVALGTSTEKNIGNGGVTTMNAGIKYKAGKDAFSLGYVAAEDDASTAAGVDKSTAAMLSYGRTLGAGVTANVNLIYAEYVGEVAGNSDDNDGVAIQTSLNVKF